MNDWTGQRVVIVGAARQGLALARYLAAHGARVVLNDNRPPKKTAKTCGSSKGWISNGSGRAPAGSPGGCRLGLRFGRRAARSTLDRRSPQAGLPLTNDSQIFMDLVPCQTVGITGSAGKTTTTTLVGRMANAGDQQLRGRSGSAEISANR